MSNRRTHDVVGALAGVGWALACAPKGAGEHIVAEAAGGALGGMLGARIPDWLEPAIHSYHRDVCHSLAVGAASAGFAVKKPVGVADWLRAKSEEFEAEKRAALADGRRLDEFVALVAELLFRFLAGLINGLNAGYVSHLICDATTPRGLPLIGGGL